MATKKLQILDYTIKQAENADTLDGKHASEFAAATDISDLQAKVGDTSVSEQINNAIDMTAVQIDLNGSLSGPAAKTNADLLDGKSFDEIENQINQAVSTATSNKWEVVVQNSEWVSDSLNYMGISCNYKNIVPINGVTPNTSIDIVRYASGDANAAKSYICQETIDGAIVFWAKEVLETFSLVVIEIK